MRRLFFYPVTIILFSIILLGCSPFSVFTVPETLSSASQRLYYKASLPVWSQDGSKIYFIKIAIPIDCRISKTKEAWEQLYGPISSECNFDSKRPCIYKLFKIDIRRKRGHQRLVLEPSVLKTWKTLERSEPRLTTQDLFCENIDSLLEAAVPENFDVSEFEGNEIKAYFSDIKLSACDILYARNKAFSAKKNWPWLIVFNDLGNPVGKYPLYEHVQPVVSFSPDNTKLFVYSTKGGLFIFDLKDIDHPSVILLMKDESY